MPSQSHLTAPWAGLGPLLGLLGLLLAALGPRLAAVARSWAALGLLLAAPGAVLGVLGRFKGHLGLQHVVFSIIFVVLFEHAYFSGKISCSFSICFDIASEAILDLNLFHLAFQASFMLIMILYICALPVLAQTGLC